MGFSFLAVLVPVAMATFTPNAPRGEQIISIAGGKSEVCVIPKKFVNGKYSSKDLKTEKELCDLGNSTPVALCAKTVSTNPAVEFYSLPQGKSAAQVEAKNCQSEDIKKLAKYKNSISCSYTPSILAYYHVSRILGGVDLVPPTVLRTLDLKTHVSIAKKGVELTARSSRDSLLNQIWSGFLRHLSNPAASSKKNILFSDDLNQSYGALSENPRGEEKYSEMFFEKSGGDTRAMAFKKRSPIYRLLGIQKPLREIVDNQWLAKNVQVVQQMKDVSEMILMDAMLTQEDRFGNIHYKLAYLFKNGSEVQKKNKLDESEVRSLDAVKIKMMMLKDNDCGVNRGNNSAKEAGLLDGIYHLNQETYTRLQNLNRELQKESSKEFFMKETMMDANDFHKFEESTESVARRLHSSCREGKLRLDLDMDSHFLNAPISQNCD